MLHGWPSGDLHEEKELLFAGLRMATRATQMVQTSTFNLPRMAALWDRNLRTATELAHSLVPHDDVPFRQTHHIVGSLVGNLTLSHILNGRDGAPQGRGHRQRQRGRRSPLRSTPSP